MGTAELKSNLKEMIADIENSDFLEVLHDLLAARKQQPGKLWKALSQKQQNEVLEAFDQSDDSEKLTDHEEVLKRY